ncbi:MAG TPA: hypothetical protein VKZ56_01645 [Membranihabitans sp.]|nr:hypothetical protein [Membranihabitans sp.]
MNQKDIWQDRLKDVRINPSRNLWFKIENRLDTDIRNSRRTILGVAAAVVLMIVAYFAGIRSVASPEYTPMTLEINDQASEVPLPVEYQNPAIKELHYKKGGHLIPNARALWENPLVPKVN